MVSSLLSLATISTAFLKSYYFSHSWVFKVFTLVSDYLKASFLGLTFLFTKWYLYIPFTHFNIHLQAIEAFSTTCSSRVFYLSGSLSILVKLLIICSGILSLSKEIISSSNLELPRSLIDAAHQSTSFLRVSLFFFLSYGLGYIIKHRAYIVSFMGWGGFFIVLRNSIYFLSRTLRASSAANRSGIASFKSFSQSSFILLASVTASETTCSSPTIISFNSSAEAFYI